MHHKASSGPRILIAGVGNIFLGDDGFGVEVVKKLSGRSFPDGVRVVDFGIRGYDLAYALLDAVDILILVDAVPRGGEPGTVYLLEVDTNSSTTPVSLDTHSMAPVQVLQFAATLGAQIQRVHVVGCEPELLASNDEIHVGLSEPVQNAVEEAVKLILSLVNELHEQWTTTCMSSPSR